MIYPEIFSLKKVSIVLIVSLVSVYLGLQIGNFIGSFAGRRNKPVSEVPVATGVPITKTNVWSGFVRKITPLDQGIEGGFKLVDSEGQITAVLQSARIDLSFLEGLKVEAEGRRIKVLEDNLPLVLVEKVKFQ